MTAETPHLHPSPRRASLGEVRPVPERFRPAADRRAWLYALLIALLFAVGGLHSVGYNNIVDTDGARHAMNGAFIHDLLTRGHYSELLHFSRVLHFAKAYYVHLPALSLPYHPPLFPFFEAIFFLIFGVNVLAARLAIALAVALSAMGLFRLVIKTHASALVAAFSTIMFLTLPYVLWLASDVMLEFPALVFVVLAIRCLADVDKQYQWKDALLFAVLAAAAVWTKQQTVFLGAVPFFYIALIGRWRLFFKLPIWISSGLFLVLVAALTLLSLPVHGAGVNQALPPQGHRYFYLHHLAFYVSNYSGVVGPAGVFLLLVFAAALAGRMLQRRSTALYASWAISALLLLVLLAPYSPRYLFFVVPPVFVLGFASLAEISGRWPATRRWVIVASGALLLATIAYSSRSRVAFMRGPDEVARMLSSLTPRRILYCGGTDGNFIFSYRSHHAPLETVILAGDKLSADVFIRTALEDFVHRYGVEYVVLEQAPRLPPRMKHPWEPLIDAPAANMVPVRDVSLASSDYRWNGMLRIYRVTNPSPTPDTDLVMRMNMIGGSMRFTMEHSLQ